jgi:polyisoprenoid-binding protein YceI
MKVFIGIVIVGILLVAGVWLLSPKAPETVEQAIISDRTETATTTSDTGFDTEKRPMVAITSFGFVGYGPGKSHSGTFEKYDVANVRMNADGVPIAGVVTFQVDSIATDNETLTKHLKEKKEFFDSASYPTATFALHSITDLGAGTFQVSGDLTVKGVTKKIDFPVQANTDKTFTSEFRIDMVPFNFGAPGVVDNEVLVTFSGTMF